MSTFPEEQVIAAVARYFKSVPSDWKLRVLTDDYGLIQSGKLVYSVISSGEFSNQLKEIALDPHRSQLIPTDIWAQVAGDLHLQEEFIKKLKSTLEGSDQTDALAEAINLSQSPGSGKVFWPILGKVNPAAYGKAIKAAIEMNESFVIALIQFANELGVILFNQLQGGMFDRIDLPDAGVHYYIYSLDHYE